MALAEIKTKPVKASVTAFLDKVQPEQKRKDSYALLEMIKKVSGLDPVMWGSSIIGFGNLRYKSPATGREVDWFLVGFSPRKANISLYLCGSIEKYTAALKKLGKHKTGAGCVYVNKLADIDLKVLAGIFKSALEK